MHKIHQTNVTHEAVFGFKEAGLKLDVTMWVPLTFCDRATHFWLIYSKIDCTHFVSLSFANVPLLQKWPVLGAVSQYAVKWFFMWSLHFWHYSLEDTLMHIRMGHEMLANLPILCSTFWIILRPLLSMLHVKCWHPKDIKMSISLFFAYLPFVAGFNYCQILRRDPYFANINPFAAENEGKRWALRYPPIPWPILYIVACQPHPVLDN